jgi:predicted ATP-binding protein involved in virulence
MIRKLSIIVVGEAGTGKTALAYQIRKALQSVGATVTEVNDTNGSEQDDQELSFQEEYQSQIPFSEMEVDIRMRDYY